MLTRLLKQPFWILCGLSVTLTSCATGEVGSGTRPTRFLSVQPIQVCNDFGIFCADLALFEAETKKLWAQADIQVDFLAPVRLNGTRFLTIDSQDEFAELSFSGGTGAFGRHPFSTRTAGPINMWFVDRIFDGLVESLGWAWIDQNGVVISDNILDLNRRDTVAHEMGHNLGLTHSNFGAGPSNNLMSDGSVRNVPTSVNDITPDGNNLGQLTARQVDYARDSSLVSTSSTLSQVSGDAGVPVLPPLFLDATSMSEAVLSADSLAGKLTMPVVATVTTTPPHGGDAVGNLPNPSAHDTSALELPEFNQVASAPMVAFQAGGAVANGERPQAEAPSPWLADADLIPPPDSEGVIQISEAAPMVQLIATTDGALTSTSAPQPIPNGPGMTLLSVGLLAAYLGCQRRAS
jgi:hypothetical protein